MKMLIRVIEASRLNKWKEELADGLKLLNSPRQDGGGLGHRLAARVADHLQAE